MVGWLMNWPSSDAKSELRDLVQNSGGRLSGHTSKHHHLAALAFDQPAFVLVDGVDGVIAALGIDVRLYRAQESEGVAIRENADAVHACECGEDEGAV